MKASTTAWSRVGDRRWSSGRSCQWLVSPRGRAVGGDEFAALAANVSRGSPSYRGDEEGNRDLQRHGLERFGFVSRGRSVDLLGQELEALMERRTLACTKPSSPRAADVGEGLEPHCRGQVDRYDQARLATERALPVGAADAGPAAPCVFGIECHSVA